MYQSIFSQNLESTQFRPHSLGTTPNSEKNVIKNKFKYFGFTENKNSDENSIDLTINYIARIPRIDYVWGSTNPSVEGWPGPGSPVTWRAVVQNRSDFSLTDIPFAWYLDGSLESQGTINFQPNNTVTIDYVWSWTFDRHEI